MPKYTVQAPDGRSFDLEGDSPPNEQELESVFSSLPKGKPLSDEDQFAQQYKQQAALSSGKKVGNLIKGVVQGPSEALGAASTEESLNPINNIGNNLGLAPAANAIEGAKRLALSTVPRAESRLEFLKNEFLKNPVGSLINPSNLVGKAAMQDLKDAKNAVIPYVPGQAEIESAYKQSQLQNAIQQEGNQVNPILGALGATPAKADVAKEILPYLIGGPEGKAAATSALPPVIGENLAKAGSVLENTIIPSKFEAARTAAQEVATEAPQVSSAVTRQIRTALKPANPQLGARIEGAAYRQFDDIVAENPMAHTTEGVMPIEGFKNSITSLKNKVLKQIDVYRGQAGGELNAGETIADALDAQADKLEKAGAPSDDVTFLRDRATDHRGKMTDLESLQDGVTSANQQNSPFYQKSFAMQNPQRANVSKIANDIIAQEGGKIINSQLESVGGKEAGALRKKFSDLKTLETESDKRISKIINQAPQEVQPFIVKAASSYEGMAGLAAIASGHPAGLIGVVGSGLRLAANKAYNALKDSNSIITKLYENRGENPSQPFVIKPPILANPEQAQAAQVQLEQAAREASLQRAVEAGKQEPAIPYY